MYKMLIFLKKGDDDLLNHFRNVTLTTLSKAAGTEIKAAEVESNILIDKKYSLFAEFSAETKDEFEKIMSSKDGKEFNKDLAAFHKNFDIIFVNYF